MIEGFHSTLAKDLLSLVIGKEIAAGSTRTVHEWLPDKSLVVKIENGERCFQNILEWQVWKSWEKDNEVSKWLAPCVEISACGTILLQKRTKPADKLPERLPWFLTDWKSENYGLLGKRFVCHDYGFIVSHVRVKERKVRWHS